MRYICITSILKELKNPPVFLKNIKDKPTAGLAMHTARFLSHFNPFSGFMFSVLIQLKTRHIYLNVSSYCSINVIRNGNRTPRQF